jgi:hypothetical protein
VSVALRSALRQEGGTLAEAVDFGAPQPEREPDDAHPPTLAAQGPRVGAHRDEYELLLEMIFEGSLLHYGTPRVVCPGDPDLALLLGDQLYALGLSRLAALGDVDAVAELGDLISLVSQAHAAGDTELAAAVWRAGAVAIGWGSSPDHEAAKALARGADPAAAGALRAAAEAVTGAAEGAPS